MLSCIKNEMIRFASRVGSSVFSVVWDSLPLCICPVVDLLQLIHEILLAPIIWLPIHICRARQVVISCTACPSPRHGKLVLNAL